MLSLTLRSETNSLKNRKHLIIRLYFSTRRRVGLLVSASRILNTAHNSYFKPVNSLSLIRDCLPFVMFQANYWTTSTATTSAAAAGASGAAGGAGALSFEALVAASTSGAAPPAHDYVAGGSASDLLSLASGPATGAATATPAVPLYTEMRSRGAAGSGIAPLQSAALATVPQHTRHSSSYTRLSSSSSTPPLSLSSPQQQQQQSASGTGSAGNQSGGPFVPTQLSTGASAVHAMQPAFSSFAPSEWKAPASVSVADTAATVAHYPHLPYEVMYVPSGSLGQQGAQNPMAAASGSASEATGLGQTAWLQSAQYAQSAEAPSAFAVGLGVGAGVDSLAQWSSMPVAVAKTPFALPPEQFAAIGRMAPLAPHEMAAVAEQMCTCRPLLPYNPFSASRLMSPRSSYPPGLETAASATTFGASPSSNLSLLEQQSNAFGSGYGMGMGMGMGLGMASAPSSSSASLRHGNELESPGGQPAHVHPAIVSGIGIGVNIGSGVSAVSGAGASASAASLARSARSSSEERRVRNNEASKRSRRNQKAKQEQMQRTLQHLEADNQTLQNRLSRAQGLVRALREQVVQHMYTTQQ